MGISPAMLSSWHVTSDSNPQKTKCFIARVGISCYALWIFKSLELYSYLKKRKRWRRQWHVCTLENLLDGYLRDSKIQIPEPVESHRKLRSQNSGFKSWHRKFNWKQNMSWDMKDLEWSYIGTETSFVPEVPIKLKHRDFTPCVDFIYIFVVFWCVFKW